MTPAADTGPRRMDADIFAQARKALDERPSIPACPAHREQDHRRAAAERRRIRASGRLGQSSRRSSLTIKSMAAGIRSVWT